MDTQSWWRRNKWAALGTSIYVVSMTVWIIAFQIGKVPAGVVAVVCVFRFRDGRGIRGGHDTDGGSQARNALPTPVDSRGDLDRCSTGGCDYPAGHFFARLIGAGRVIVGGGFDSDACRSSLLQSFPADIR